MTAAQPLDTRDGPMPSAQALLIEVAAGDMKAFAQLYDLISAPVFRLVQHIVGDAAQSEEVTQEVLVEVWRTATRYRPERGSALAWTLTLARRRAVDRVRSSQAATDREARSSPDHCRHEERHLRQFDIHRSLIGSTPSGPLPERESGRNGVS